MKQHVKKFRFNPECGKFCHDKVERFSLLFKSYIQSPNNFFFLTASLSLELSAGLAYNYYLPGLVSASIRVFV